MRNDFKDYYNKITTKVKKSRGVVEAYIIKVQNDNENIKKKDIVYLNKGVKDGLLPGDILTIYKSIANKETGGNDVYHKTGKLMIINSMKDSAVAVVTNQKSVIHVGDVVRTAK